jgi:multiple sugar transport system substrate-binding protein
MTNMIDPSRRSVLRGSLAVAASAGLARPYIANAAATTATAWWTQGFAPEEDVAFRKMVADYEKASGNTIDYSIVPFAPLRQKEISAITSGAVPDIMEFADFEFMPLNSWQDKLVDVSDIVETQKSQYIDTALHASYCYNNAAKKRSYYGVPMKAAAVPFRYWRSLIEKAGYKDSDVPKTWDAFLDFFKPVQDKLRAQGMRNIYAYGYQLTATGVDPNITFEGYMIAYGGGGLVTPDGKLHTDDPQVKEAAVKALTKLTTPYKEGYVPPGVTSWNDADDNNAFHSKLIVMDFDGSLSTEVALYHDKEQYNDIVTYGMPLSNDGKKLESPLPIFGAVIPKGGKNPALAQEFLKYAIEPKVLNEYLKGGLGRWAIPMPAMAKSDPFWLDPKDPHRVTYIRETLFSPTLPLYEAFNPAAAEVNTQQVFPLAEFDVMKNGMAPEAAIDKAFKHLEAIFAKYPIQQA